LFVASDAKAILCAKADSQNFATFIGNAMRVYTTLGKADAGFDFLTALENQVECDDVIFDAALDQAITCLVRHCLTLPREQIESTLLSRSFTER